MLLMIDNYDSFTYNIVQYFQALDQVVTVYRHDAITLSDIVALKPKYIVISPGPGNPEDAGISVDVIKTFSNQFPILGVCLGHQSIAYAYGASIMLASQIMHGKTSLIEHNNQGVFEKLPNPLTATRYHSLIVDQHTLPASFSVSAWVSLPNGQKEIMGIKHLHYPLEGVQFHPESILTDYGYDLFKNFLNRYANFHLQDISVPLT